MSKEIEKIINKVRFSEEEFEQAKKDIQDLFCLLKKNKVPAFPLLDRNLIMTNAAVNRLSDIRETLEIINPDYERVYFSHGEIYGKSSYGMLGSLTCAGPSMSHYLKGKICFTLFYVYDAKNKIFFYFKNGKFIIYDVDENLEFQEFKDHDSPERMLLLMKKEVQWTY